MLRSGYVVEERYNLTSQQFIEAYADEARTEIQRTKIDIYAAKAGDADEEGKVDQILVFFPEGTNIGVKPIRDYKERMMKDEGAGPVYRAIIVVQDKLSSYARTAIARSAPKFTMEHFRESELLVDIVKHTLVPPHTVLSEDEKAALLERYKLVEQQLPRIQLTDPVARYYGMQRNQVVKIERVSETAGRYLTYRLVQ